MLSYKLNTKLRLDTCKKYFNRFPRQSITINYRAIGLKKTENSKENFSWIILNRILTKKTSYGATTSFLPELFRFR